MQGTSELIERLASSQNVNFLAAAAQAKNAKELISILAEDPESFIDSASDLAFMHVALAVDEAAALQAKYREMEDEKYFQTMEKLYRHVQDSMKTALSIDGDCIDARQIALLLSNELSVDSVLEKQYVLLEEAKNISLKKAVGFTGEDNPWDFFELRPYLRSWFVLIDLLCTTGRYVLARRSCYELLEFDPLDNMNIRYTLALILARLEAEDELNDLDARFDQESNDWMLLARVLLMYKLDRMPAARRALKGLCKLEPALAFFMLHPLYIDPYLPDRPYFEPGDERLALIAGHEGDFIIADTPGFMDWASQQKSFVDTAQAYAKSKGFEF